MTDKTVRLTITSNSKLTRKDLAKLEKRIKKLGGKVVKVEKVKVKKTPAISSNISKAEAAIENDPKGEKRRTDSEVCEEVISFIAWECELDWPGFYGHKCQWHVDDPASIDNLPRPDTSK